MAEELAARHPGNAVRLRTFLGTAPGVGKTYALLGEGWRVAETGAHVVIGWLEPHCRAATRAQVRDLEVVPPRATEYRGRSFDEMDVPAILARQPDVVLVDELAHTNADGVRRRWEDVRGLLAAGINVMTTVNVANLHSVRDYAARITGAGTVESVPDEFVRGGDVVLVDLPPEALRRRIAAGSVYSAEGMDGALSNYFRAPNLARLSQLARAWMDGTVDTIGPDLLSEAGLEALARPTVVAGVSGSEWSEPVIRQAALLAADEDADLLVVHVKVADGRRRRDASTTDRNKAIAIQAGGAYTEVSGTSAVDSLAETARRVHATRVVVARHRSRLGELVRGSVAARLRRLVPDVQVDEVHASN